ncbi:MAG: transglycosylase domain-containing protein [Christensenellaceae bacterium]|jgi:penicillin-binding protein 2A|nr:transglycosylase domain-containing protein [Christensenellaceae bacterium]
MKKARRGKRTKKVFAVFAVAFLTLTLVLGVSAFFIFRSQTLSAEKLVSNKNLLSFYSASGEQMTNPKQTRLSSAEINETTKNAFIAVEDKRFYSHNGLDLKRIIKATLNNIKSGYSREGASTISQQLIKNTHLTNEKTFERKIKEAVLATKLESEYSKDEILTLYLNAIYFGNGITGIGSAAQNYFGKESADLTALESACLAGMIKNPVKFDPIANTGVFVSRGKLVLSLMRSQDLISQVDFEAAQNEDIKLSEILVDNATSYKRLAEFEAAEILNISVQDLSNYGYRINTYFDANAQNAISKTLAHDDLTILNASGEAADRVALLANPQGKISAGYISNRLLANARRNFGSVLKPLSVYAPALENGVINAATFIDDSEFFDGNFAPENNDKKFRGLVSARESLSKSLNVPAVKILQTVGIPKSEMLLNALNLPVERESLGLALGATTGGLKFTELLGGYCALSSGGFSVNPTTIKSIETRDGKVIYRDNLTREFRRALGEDTAFIVSDMLKDCAENGTAKVLSALPFSVSAKTGSNQRQGSNTNTDATIVSYTPENVLLVWAGNTDMKPENDLPRGLTGGSIPAFIAKTIFNNLVLTQSEFEVPPSVELVDLDLQDLKNGTPKLANEKTPTEQKVSEYISKRFMPTEVSRNFAEAVAPTLDGGLADNGLPEIFFEVKPEQVYEIYNGEILKEVIKEKSNIYNFVDKTPNEINEYSVKTYLTENFQTTDEPVIETSNSIKILTQTSAITQPREFVRYASAGKRWFFT